MGECVENEVPAPSGDSVQQTANGLAVYRKADNWTAFTDGDRTWIDGPGGVQSRLNTERFPWEADAGTPGTTAIATVPVLAAFDPTRVALRLEPLVRGLAGPLQLTHAADGSGRAYVAEKRGIIRVIDGGAILPAPLLDIQPLVRSSGSEQGLLGLAFHPRYAQNGYLYVNYTDSAGNTVVARYTARASGGTRDIADPSTAQIVLRIPQPAANHNGGNLVFGPDGYLYIGTGDGGGAGDQFRNAQNGQALLGKMLRLDVDRAERGNAYAIPPDNPFAGVATARPEIWFTGLRNPWRYTFDRATGDLYIADVGQNMYEEVNFVAAGTPGGLNFGWPRTEGLHCYPANSTCDRDGFVQPIGEYAHSLGCSITGGYVYRGRQSPLLVGAYLFGDYCSGRIWSLHRDPAGKWVQTELLDTDVQISSFGEDEAGELYVTGLGDGTVYRVVAMAR
ncbi:MAG: PQQ-dependent sugar dehydrogenase [Chloroflexi bacterium]|nr:PQQ-dependent sugar dehydrogenase [Chloroflexota bacterium]